LGEAAQAELATAAEALRPICHARDVALLTTDAYGRVEALGLDGAHLDAQAAAQSTARARLGPERIMGVHCGRSLDRCFEAGDRRADYVSVGPVGDDLDAEDPGLWTVLEAWREHVVLPLVIEGDLSPASAARLAPWADFIALGAPIWDAPDGPGAAVSRYLKALDAARDADPGG
ncbi:MAG: thiamine phosphate synthase, partial [Pseudomonadota bacterium]